MAQETSPGAEAVKAVNGHEGATATTQVPAKSGEHGGLPQFEMQYWGGQIFWVLIIFALFYFLIARVFTPRMRKVLDTRAETISGAIAEARRAQAEAEEQALTAQAEIADARSQSLRVAADARAKSKAEADARTATEETALNAHLEEAEGRIRASRDQVMSQVGAIATETAQAMVARLSTAATANELAKAQAA